MQHNLHKAHQVRRYCDQYLNIVKVDKDKKVTVFVTFSGIHTAAPSFGPSGDLRSAVVKRECGKRKSSRSPVATKPLHQHTTVSTRTLVSYYCSSEINYGLR